MKKILLSALAFSTLISAGELVTHTELGFIKNSGNTENETLTLDMKLKKEWEKQISTTLLQGKYNEENKVETGNNWLFETQYDYKFSETFAFNYLLGYKSDKFSSFDYQLYTGPGLKYIAFHESKVHNLNFALNYLYSEDKNTITDKTDNYQAARLAMEYSWQISKNLKFSQDATYRNNVEDTDIYFAYGKSTISAKVSDHVSAGLSYKLDYTNEVDPNKERVDRTLTANLIVDY